MLRRIVARTSSRVQLATAVLLLVAAGLWFAKPTSDAVSVRRVHGFTSAVNGSGTAIGLDGDGYVIAGADWRDCKKSCKPWHEGSAQETCVKPLSSGRELELGVVDVKPTDDAAGRTVVVWLQCLAGTE